MRTTRYRYLLLSLTVVMLLCSTTSCISFGAGWFMTGYSLKPGGNKAARDTAFSWRNVRQDKTTAAWLDSLNSVGALRDTFITCKEKPKYRLHAWYVKASRPTAATIVVVHGYTNSGITMMPYARMFSRDMGYNVLVPDLRYAGLSDGNHIQMGWRDRLDVEQWIDILPTIFGDSIQVAVHGVSMGAATVMMLSGDELPSYVKALIEDCGYTSVWAEFKKELKTQFHLPPFPLMYTANAVCRMRYGWSFRKASAIAQLKKSTLPMLFIHGTADTFVPYTMLDELYAAKPNNKWRWDAPNAAHAETFWKYRKEYAQRVRKFIEEHIGSCL